jgi:hypothetical protein
MMILRRSYWSFVKAEYELAFDLKTAKTLGLKIPQSPPMFAEDVIE